ncbi:Aldehyde dehydrogenase B [Oligella ureolytica]|nr:Aldehyde dehydrogenase B [Oligella ureolytica]
MSMTDLKRFGIDLDFPFKKRYDNYIGGKWVPPVAGNYFENISPITGQVFCDVARSDKDDINLALDAAHAAFKAWAATPVQERSAVLLRIGIALSKILSD